MAKNVIVDLAVGHLSYSFKLCRRELNFGQAGLAQYLWMDSRSFRLRNPGPNFRACVDYWWQLVTDSGQASVDEQATLVLAEAYPLVSTSRSTQNVCVDAHLHPKADREPVPARQNRLFQGSAERTYSLPKQEVQRLRSLVDGEDVDLIRREFDDLFLGEMPGKGESIAFQDAYEAWIGNGVVHLQKGGRGALRDYLKDDLGRWLRKLRKDSSTDRIRLFLNLFADQCKIAFYHCYSIAWTGLLQRLVDDGQVDVIGERFMRLWHYQNQLSDQGLPDVLCGRVLALHPLSAIVLQDPGYLGAIGNWLAHPACDRLMQTGQQFANPEYKAVVATILMAAHEYDHARRHWKRTRARPTAGRPRTAKELREAVTPPVSRLLEEFARAQNWECPQCQRMLQYVSHAYVTDDKDCIRVRYRCRLGHEAFHLVTAEQIDQQERDTM
jgi:hypothetical protein